MKHHDARRNSGGLGIFVRNNIVKCVQLLRHPRDVIALLRLDKDYFRLATDLFIANLYLVPIGSTHLTDDPFNFVNDDLAQLPYYCQILVCDDWNATTGIRVGYNVDGMRGSNDDFSLLLPDNDITHTFKDAMVGKLHSRQMLTRYSADAIVNAHGKPLLGFFLISIAFRLGLVEWLYYQQSYCLPETR